MGLRDDQRLVIRQDVISRVLDGEAVLLDLASGTYFGLDEVGTAIWELMKGGATVRDIRETVLARYEVDEATVTKDLEELVAELVKSGLVDVS